MANERQAPVPLASTLENQDWPKAGNQVKTNAFDCDFFNTNSSNLSCNTNVAGAEPANFFEAVVMGATTLVANDGEEIARDPYTYFKSKGSSWAITQATAAANKQIQKIPFLAQTSIGMDQETGSAGSFYIDSFLKLSEIGADSEGDPLGIVFGQARWKAAWGVSGSTINTGIGTRYRIGNDSMLGVNGFWDYRIVQYATSHSRFGVGVEAFHKDFELRNNWYIAGTGTKVIAETATTITYERVVPGWDVELGYRLPDYPQLAIYLKGFRWNYVSRNDNTGLGGGVNWQATPHINLEVAASQEIPAYLTYAPPTDNNNIFVNFKIKYTFNKIDLKKRDYRQINVARMVEPVRRRYDVLLERFTKNKATGNLSVTFSGV